MQVIVCDTNGSIHKSDRHSKARIMEEENFTEEQYQDMVAAMQKMFKRLDDLEHVTVTVNGAERVFNPQHIVWVEVDTDD